MDFLKNIHILNHSTSKSVLTLIFNGVLDVIIISIVSGTDLLFTTESNIFEWLFNN